VLARSLKEADTGAPQRERAMNRQPRFDPAVRSGDDPTIRSGSIARRATQRFDRDA